MPTTLSPFGSMVRTFTKHVLSISSEGRVLMVQTPSGEFKPIQINADGQVISGS